MTTTELHVRVSCSCVACVIWLCKEFGDFGKRKRERAWRVTRKLGSLVILAKSERESAWRITGKHFERVRKGNGLDGRVLHRSIIEK